MKRYMGMPRLDPVKVYAVLKECIGQGTDTAGHLLEEGIGPDLRCAVTFRVFERVDPYLPLPELEAALDKPPPHEFNTGRVWLITDNGANRKVIRVHMHERIGERETLAHFADNGDEWGNPRDSGGNLRPLPPFATSPKEGEWLIRYFGVGPAMFSRTPHRRVDGSMSHYRWFPIDPAPSSY